MKIRTSESALSADTAAGVLDGVCAMSDDHPEVRAVIAAVSLKLRRSGSTLSPTDVKELLLPMRYSAGIYPERQELLETIFNMVEKKPSADQLVQENLAVGMYGLQEMNADRNPAVAKAYAVMGNWTLQAIKHTPTFALDGKHTGTRHPYICLYRHLDRSRFYSFVDNLFPADFAYVDRYDATQSKETALCEQGT
jgi:hypothetical protein